MIIHKNINNFYLNINTLLKYFPVKFTIFGITFCHTKPIIQTLPIQIQIILELYIFNQLHFNPAKTIHMNSISHPITPHILYKYFIYPFIHHLFIIYLYIFHNFFNYMVLILFLLKKFLLTNLNLKP